MKKFLLASLAVLSLATACKKNDDAPVSTTKQLSGDMKGTNEVPANTSTATGSVTGTFDTKTMLFNYTIAFSGLSGPASGAHFHFGDAKHHTGTVFISLTKDTTPTSTISNGTPAATSGTITGSTTLTSMQADSLIAGHVYANIHSKTTTSYSSEGEIRGTVVVK